MQVYYLSWGKWGLVMIIIHPPSLILTVRQLIAGHMWLIRCLTWRRWSLTRWPQPLPGRIFPCQVGRTAGRLSRAYACLARNGNAGWAGGKGPLRWDHFGILAATDAADVVHDFCELNWLTACSIEVHSLLIANDVLVLMGFCPLLYNACCKKLSCWAKWTVLTSPEVLRHIQWRTAELFAYQWRTAGILQAGWQPPAVPAWRIPSLLRHSTSHSASLWQ